MSSASTRIETVPAMPEAPARRGSLIINADDWGRDRDTTDRTLECVQQGSVSSVSAMVFMEDSERAADIALTSAVDAGIHLNFTAPYTGKDCSGKGVEHHQAVCTFLRRHAMARLLFHPGLKDSFEYVVSQQMDEYCRLYRKPPQRVDGHHHQHLCSNVLLQKLLPQGAIVRRNFVFAPGEKSLVNRFYRSMIDKSLAKRHQLVDYLFALPLPEIRLREIVALSKDHVVELETHPINSAEYELLTNGTMFGLAGDTGIASRFAMPTRAARTSA
ncbi:MAG: ChbG/HpnK family deacetylase [Bryobacteraceae bacterium]